MFTSLSTTTCVSNILIGFPLPVFQWVTGLRMFTLDIFQLWEVTFICRGNQGTWIKQQTCCKSLYHITLFYSVPLPNLDIFVLCFWFSGFAAAGNDRPTEDIDEDDDGVPGKFR
jgi:hypothetical protein